MPSYKCYDWAIVRTGSAAASAAARANGGVDGWNQTVNRGGFYHCLRSGRVSADRSDGPVPDPDDPEFQFWWPAALPRGFVALSYPQSLAPKRGQGPREGRQIQRKGRHAAGPDRDHVGAAHAANGRPAAVPRCRARGRFRDSGQSAAGDSGETEQ